MIKLLTEVESFENVGDRESDVAFFRTHVPWVAPEAYLHIIHKPATHSLLSHSAKKLRMPEPFVDFLAHQNGAHLFAGSLYIFGIVPHGQLLNRGRSLSLPPFNIEQNNVPSKGFDNDSFLAIGGYGFNGSTVCLDRRNGRVSVFPRGGDLPHFSWLDLEDWIRSEITRLSFLFDKKGNRLVDESLTVPPRRNPSQ